MICTVAIPRFKKDLFRVYMQSKYTASLRRAGIRAVWLDTSDPDKAVERMLHCDGLLMPGGEDVDPGRYGQLRHEKCGEIVEQRDHLEMKMLEAFVPTGKPVLGICRGVQMMNVYFGGTLHQDIGHIAGCCHDDYPRRRRGNHRVHISRDSALASIFEEETILVNSLHHQAVDRVAPSLRIAAVSEDGITEAVELPGHRFCIGVQWHPEHMSATSGMQRKLFRAFAQACRKSE